MRHIITFAQTCFIRHHPTKIPHSSCGDDDSPVLSDVFTASPALSPIDAFPNISLHLTTSAPSSSVTVNTPSSPTPPPIPTSSPPPLDDQLELPTIPWDLVSGHCFTSSLHLAAQNMIELSQLQQKNGDLDSIDRLDDDCVDAIKMSTNGLAAKGNTKQQQADDKEDKTVTCLYYALQCCECNIS